ncbi:hypothetical protein P20480_3895 [Pseudoalteromonas sp. BSi20480]|nr:hypothetical protein P20480_3895 [Pseudoalteromonas sp. BSi20480]
MYPIAPANNNIKNEPKIAGVNGATASNMQTNRKYNSTSNYYFKHNNLNDKWRLIQVIKRGLNQINFAGSA